MVKRTPIGEWKNMNNIKKSTHIKRKRKVTENTYIRFLWFTNSVLGMSRKISNDTLGSYGVEEYI